MNEFMKFFYEKTRDYPMHLKITYCKICEWEIHIFKRGAGENGSDLEIFHDWGHCDPEYLFAKAQIALKDHLSEFCGGY